MKSVLSELLGFIFERLAVGSIDLFLAFASPSTIPNPETGDFPALRWVVVHLLLVALLTVVAGCIAAWPARASGIPHALGLSGLMLVIGAPGIIGLMSSHPIFALTALVIPVPSALLGARSSRWIRQLLSSAPLTMEQRGAMRGAMLGFCLAWILLAVGHAGDPHYPNSRTAKSVYWFWAPRYYFWVR